MMNWLIQLLEYGLWYGGLASSIGLSIYCLVRMKKLEAQKIEQIRVVRNKQLQENREVRAFISDIVASMWENPGQWTISMDEVIHVSGIKVTFGPLYTSLEVHGRWPEADLGTEERDLLWEAIRNLQHNRMDVLLASRSPKLLPPHTEPVEEDQPGTERKPEFASILP